MSLIRKHRAVLQAWACLALVRYYFRHNVPLLLQILSSQLLLFRSRTFFNIK